MRQHSASLTMLPSVTERTIFAVRRAGYEITDTRNGRLETRHSSFSREKRPSRHHQFGHSQTPGGGPDFPGAA